MYGAVSRLAHSCLLGQDALADIRRPQASCPSQLLRCASQLEAEIVLLLQQLQGAPSAVAVPAVVTARLPRKESSVASYVAIAARVRTAAVSTR